jgi:tRNA 2-thiouridine synthesizing protein A
VIRLAARAKGLAPGTEIVVLATDPAARHDVPAWARMRGHLMVDEPGDTGAGPGDGQTWRLRVRLTGA